MPTSLELQKAKSRDLNQRIKNEKLKIDQRLDCQLIKQANLDHGQLSMQEIRSLSVKLVKFLSQENQATSVINPNNQFLLLGDIFYDHPNAKNA